MKTEALRQIRRDRNVKTDVETKTWRHKVPPSLSDFYCGLSTIRFLITVFICNFMSAQFCGEIQHGITTLRVLIPYGKNSQKYTEKNRQNNPQVTLRVTLKTHSQLGVNSDRSEYSIEYLLSIQCNPPIERLFPISVNLSITLNLIVNSSIENEDLRSTIK